VIESKRQAIEFVFPGEYLFDGVEPFFKDGRIEERLTRAP
jgi:hypothetical protein